MLFHLLTSNISHAIIKAPSELRERNYRRYEWWTPCAIHAEDYEYDSVPGGNVWIGRPGHDVPVEVYGADGLATLFYTVTPMTMTGCRINKGLIESVRSRN